MSVATFESHRPRLRALAYRMLGSRSDADDMVQEAWLRWQAVDPVQVHDARAYLCRTTTHLCLDHLQSARARREQYVGLWLPEPVVDGALADYCDPGPEAALGLRQHISLGFLLALQHLSPLERAAFLLHDVFDLGFEEVAQTLERSAAACRQLASRARKRLQAQGFGADSPVPQGADSAQTQALLGAFAQALASGDVQALAALLAEDVRLYSDGGGVVCAVPAPLDGRLRVAQALLSFARTWQREAGEQALRAACVNGQPGALVWNAQGALEDVCALDLDASGRVRGVYFQRNPAKLARLGPYSQ
ncbi:MAG: RNA polymerase sigma factor SigJ [Rhodoferax sp.]